MKVNDSERKKTTDLINIAKIKFMYNRCFYTKMRDKKMKIYRTAFCLNSTIMYTARAGNMKFSPLYLDVNKL